MADKKTNDILEEQRRSREEFLKLKKMQSGEMDAGPKPSEVAIVPKTPKEKAANFWFQYKWHTIAIAFITVVLAVLIAQCASRVEPDFSIVYFSYTPIMDDQLKHVTEYFEKFASDLNGDGEVNVQVVNCSFSNNGTNQYKSTILTKLQAILVSDQKALLFITDKDSIGYFSNLDSELFEEEPIALGEDFYSKTETEEFGKLTEGLQISCRRVEDTLIEKGKDVGLVYEEAQKILQEIKAK